MGQASFKGEGGGVFHSVYGEAPPERDTFFRMEVYEKGTFYLFHMEPRYSLEKSLSDQFLFLTWQSDFSPC